MIIKIAAVAHSKHRSMIGLVAISCDTKTKTLRVRLAKEWSRDILNKIPEHISYHYNRIKWDDTLIDQLTGKYIIDELKRKELNVSVINTQKDLKDPKGIEKSEIMDKIEMVHMFLTFRQNKQIEFHPNPTTGLRLLESQMEIYTEHKTEAGGIDYFPPGKEHDHLTKSLLMCCFKMRDILSGDNGLPVVGPMYGRKNPRHSKGPDYKRDTDVISTLSRGPPGRFIHYY